MKGEIWKDIKGYEGIYQISSLGRVRSLYRPVGDGTKRHWHGRVLQPTGNGNGYLIVGLRDNGVRKNHYVHRLVAEHFLEGWKKDLEVDHIDYNRHNNAAENLRMVTRQENIDHSYDRICESIKKRKRRTGRTGEQYIGYRCGKYRVFLPGASEKSFDTIGDAIGYREEMLRENKS